MPLTCFVEAYTPCAAIALVLYLLYQRMWVNILIGTLPFQFPEVSRLV